MEKSLHSSAKHTDKEFIVIGKIGAPHGLKGEVRVISLTDFPDRFKSLQKVYIDDVSVDITSVRDNKQFILLCFKQYTSREQVMLLSGRLIKIDRAEAVPLAAGEYYTFDIIGLDVYDEHGLLLGKVMEVLKTGSNDVYVVGSKGNAKQVLIPALKKVVQEINIAEGRMSVILPKEME